MWVTKLSQNLAQYLTYEFVWINIWKVLWGCIWSLLFFLWQNITLDSASCTKIVQNLWALFKKINTLCAMLYFICSNKMHTFLLCSSYDVTLCLKWVSNNAVTHLRLPGWFQVLGLTIWWKVYEQWKFFFFFSFTDGQSCAYKHQLHRFTK